MKRQRYIALLTTIAAQRAVSELLLIIENQMPSNVFRQVCERELGCRFGNGSAAVILERAKKHVADLNNSVLGYDRDRDNPLPDKKLA